MGKLRVLSLFSGIGAFEKALYNLGIDVELVNFCEIDKYAIESYCAIHNIDKTLNLGDITKIDLDSLPNNIDLLTHGSPCTDYSIAGRQNGGDKDSGTRSSLMWNSVEIIRKVKPKCIIWENVKNVLSEKHRHNFEQYMSDLSEIGYTSSYDVLNSCDFGIPQNRERIFCVSVLNGEKFIFPKAPKIPCKLKDVLDDIVDEKYYINKPFVFVDKKDNDSACSRIANVELNGHDYLKRVYDTEKCSPTLPTGTGGNHEPKILVDMKKNYIQYDLSGKGHNSQDQRAYYENGLHGTLPATGGESKCKVLESTMRVRKLTPKECFRLQAFSDDDFDRCVAVGISNSQLYRQAGNSITVRVLEYIFKELFNGFIK